MATSIHIPPEHSSMITANAYECTMKGDVRYRFVIDASTF